MATNLILCRVKALYSFESNDPSSLRFEEGDFIDVLSKLPSGWWDGWCNGNRGWFPSNFVKVIEEYSSTEPIVQPKITSRTSSELFDDGINLSRSNTNTSLPLHWVIQNRQDGTASYYLNTLTGEMRSAFPSDELNSIYDESDEDSGTSTVDSNFRSEDQFDSLMFDQSLKKGQQGKWIQRTTPQGLPFFHNLSTHETTWHAEDQLKSPKIQLGSPMSTKTASLPLDNSSFENQEALSWNKLSFHVMVAINSLIASAKNSQRSLYKRYAANVVEAVRFMLVASGTINKESDHIKSNHILRSQHRAMMASMSKLVLSAQLCADGTVTDISKLLTDCHELLVAVRHFTSTCETVPVELHSVDPSLLQQPVPWEASTDGPRTKYKLQPDLMDNLKTLGNSMQESITSLLGHLNRRHESKNALATLLFTQYRNFGNQNGQFLSLIEDIDFESVLNSPLMKELAVGKQKLYDGLGVLFFKMQTMTDESVPLEKVSAEIETSAQSIIRGIQSICDCMSQLVTLDEPLSEFLRDSGDGHDLSLDLSLSSTLTLRNPSIDGIGRQNGQRSLSVDIDPLPVMSNSTKLNRSSAPVSETSPMMADALKHRSQTLTDAKQTAKLKSLLNESEATSPTGDLGGRKLSTTPSVATTAALSSQEDEQRYLQYDYSPSEIMFTTEGTVKGGTLRALVERMTLHDYLDMNFNSTFLLTYRSFCTSFELLELLEARYNIQPPTDLTPEELEIWVNKKQKLIRLRVFNVLKIWLEQYYYEEDSVILDRLMAFTNTSIKDTLSFSAYQLERLIQKRKDACKDLKKLVITQPQDSPEPILPRNLKKFKLLDLDPLEMARQLTLMDFKMYSSIKPVECLDKAWSRDANGDQPVAVNIKGSIDYCNQVTTWVSDVILSQSDIKKRSTYIKYWVSVAERCRLFNNFNTCMAILSAFDNSAIGRLKRTWELVGARTHHIVAQIRKLMGANRNFNNYRAIIHSINPPCIPFLGIYLQDLTFIEDGNPKCLKAARELINFAKRAKTAEVIREMQQYQTMGYHFRPVEEVQHFIAQNLNSTRDEDQLYKESLKLEPKEREDEKITRLLQESGFL